MHVINMLRTEAFLEVNYFTIVGVDFHDGTILESEQVLYSSPIKHAIDLNSIKIINMHDSGNLTKGDMYAIEVTPNTTREQLENSIKDYTNGETVYFDMEDKPFKDMFSDKATLILLYDNRYMTRDELHKLFKKSDLELKPTISLLNVRPVPFMFKEVEGNYKFSLCDEYKYIKKDIQNQYLDICLDLIKETSYTKIKSIK